MVGAKAAPAKGYWFPGTAEVAMLQHVLQQVDDFLAKIEQTSVDPKIHHLQMYSWSKNLMAKSSQIGLCSL